LKKWKKLVWTHSRAFIALRLTDLSFAGLEIGEPYEYLIEVPQKRKLIIKLRKRKED
jgi:hypothetical protein